MRSSLIFLFFCASLVGSIFANPYAGSHTGTGFSLHTVAANANNGTAYSANLVTGLSGTTGDYVGSYKSDAGANAILLLVTDLSGTTYLVLLKDAPEVAPGWAQSSWLGFFEKASYPWIYHENLGWLRVDQSVKEWAWMYSEEMGWVWTNASLYPSVYMDNWKRWSYVERPNGSGTQLYDYGNKEWFPLGQRYELQVAPEPSAGGFVFGAGTGSYKRWDTISLTAHPSSGYVFSSWSGDAVGDQLQFSTEAIRNLAVQAIFSPVPAGNAGGKLAFDAIAAMDHLSETEKRQAVADLLVLGYSDKASLSVVSSKQPLPKNFAVDTFGNDSATLSHDYFAGELNSRWTYEDEQGNDWYSDATAVEATHGVQSLKVESLMTDGPSSRWYAQDNTGNLWVLRETFADGRENQVPWVFLPVQPEQGWVVDDVGFDGLVSISKVDHAGIEISYQSGTVTLVIPLKRAELKE